MKKIAIILAGAVIAQSLCACACTNNGSSTTPSTDTQPATTGNMPTTTVTMPVPETNIPDPSVDTTLPSGTNDGGNGTEGRMGGMMQ